MHVLLQACTECTVHSVHKIIVENWVIFFLSSETFWNGKEHAYIISALTTNVLFSQTAYCVINVYIIYIR